MCSIPTTEMVGRRFLGGVCSLCHCQKKRGNDVHRAIIVREPKGHKTSRGEERQDIDLGEHSTISSDYRKKTNLGIKILVS